MPAARASGALISALLAVASGLAVAASLGAAGAPRSEAEVDSQQECEQAAARVEALQRRSALTGSGAPTEEEELEESRVGAEMEGNLYAPGPNVYLATLVDPRNFRSYCLDIAGSPPHPQCNSIQGHSCKTEGEDTQFEYDPDTKSIRSVNFNGQCNPLYSGSKNGRSWEADLSTSPACLTVRGKFEAGSTFSLTSCTGSDKQRFSFTSRGQFVIGDGSSSLCIVLGVNATNYTDQDFFTRPAELQDCESWPTELSTWKVLLPDHTFFSGTDASSSQQ
ncbi:unnamed protein product [Prorocentrum cordatum]|uniref:Ricin B lectin domain-containing protein n=1 Tax=Prorocentrum cordatum TaxID=2364126 RepID=A0ABN9W1I1_9DINO|nr:unnamed protein product [Polarella glacialis]